MEIKSLYPKYTEVINLTDKDFKIDGRKVKIINKHFKDKMGLIVFYAPWCIHCKNMVEMWSDLAIQFKNIFPIGAVNSDREEEISNKLKIRYYPTIKVVTKKGNISNYKGRMDKDELIYYICSKI